MVRKRIFVWDLDHTILNTERKLFGPVLEQVADFMNLDMATVGRVFNEVNATTFSWENWFTALGMDRETGMFMRERLEIDIAERIASCVYPGMIDLLRECATIGSQVLVTAGDPVWQRWKFEQLPPVFCEIFALEDRHFVPLSGSKADVILRYNAISDDRIFFFDDSPKWLTEVHEKGWYDPLIRPQWPDTDGTKDHPDDSRLWDVARSADEIMAAIYKEWR